MAHGKKLRIAIDACVSTAAMGGVAPVTTSLISALGQLPDDGEDYLIVVDSAEEVQIVEPLLGNNQRCVLRQRSVARRALRRGVRLIKRLNDSVLDTVSLFPPRVALSDGFLESLKCDVVHYVHQNFAVCSIPSIYNPHDLQHLHFPEFFPPAHLAAREVTYRTGCNHAHRVVAASQWIKDDLVAQYSLAPSRIQVIPWAPPTQSVTAPSPTIAEEVTRQYQLQIPFAFFPAMTWPHKNHIRLLQATALLRDQRGVRVNLVCTGSQREPAWSEIKQVIHELDLASQVSFLGLVPEQHLRALYQLCQFLVMPTLFESDSSPIYEAWLEGTPVASSNVTSLPAQVLDAGVLFDPYDIESIAGALERMTSDDDLRRELRVKGKTRLSHFSWERTAKAYRALYRSAARAALSAEDRSLLAWDWMLNPYNAVECCQ